MFALFFDILGVADVVSATESSLALDAKSVSPADESGDPGHAFCSDDVTRVGRQLSIFHAGVNALYGQAIKRAGKAAEMFVFSDSAFLVTEDIYGLVEFSRLFIEQMYSSGVPIRGGIARGTYSRGTFVQRALSNGDFFSQTPFGGSCITKSYRAQACGVKGLRILVHDSAAAAILTEVGEVIVPLAADEVRPGCANELNILPDDVSFEGTSANGFDLLLQPLVIMQRYAPVEAQVHYERTVASIIRMREVAESRPASSKRHRTKRLRLRLIPDDEPGQCIVLHWVAPTDH